MSVSPQTREGAEASLYGGLSLLGALTRLGAQCVRLRRGEAWSSPEARPCDGLMTGKHLLSVLPCPVLTAASSQTSSGPS